MSALRSIETSSYAKFEAATDLGDRPRLDWIPIAQLGVDETYQREIQGLGRTNVRRIAKVFDWSKFAPVIVSRVGDRFAIVDGQHRTTAAALCGVDKVPCAIIVADGQGQAAAFRAINSVTTRLTSLQLYHAGVAAGDADACRVASVCKAAGVTILKYPKSYETIMRGETMAPVVIGRALRKFGEAVVDATLRALGKTDAGLNGIIIYGLAEVLADHREWMTPRLVTAFDFIDVLDLRESACAKAARMRGTSATDQFEAMLVDALGRYFKVGKQ